MEGTGGASPSRYRFPIEVGGEALGVIWWGNRPLVPDLDVRRVALVVHGTGRDAESYARSMMMAADQAGAGGSTAIIAPHFPTESDVGDDTSLLCWGSQGWKQGDLSRSTDRPWRMSSFDVADRFLSAAAAVFPAADEFVVVGHSAGGQFVDRYTAGSRVDLPRPVRYIVANPSSYLYWNGHRWFDGVSRALTEEERSACPDWDTYKYGLDGLNTWMRGIGVDALRERRVASDVVLMLGDADNFDDGSLDVSGPAMLMGANRWERGLRYRDHAGSVLGVTVPLVAVRGVGHSARAMFTSPEGVALLFGSSMVDPDAGAEVPVDPADPVDPVRPGRKKPKR